MENMNLIVNVEEGAVTSNLAEIRKQLAEKLKEYDVSAFTGEDAVKEMKTGRAELNKLSAALKKRKKEAKELFNKPWGEFESELKLLTDAVEAAARELDEKIKEAESRLREANRKEIEGFYKEYVSQTGLCMEGFQHVLLGRIYDPRWENISMPKKTWKTAIMDAVDGYLQNESLLVSMNEPEFFARALEKYQESLDIRDGIEYINARKAEREALERERIRIAAEEKARAERELEEAKRRAEAEAEEAKRKAEEARRKAEAEAREKAERELEEAKRKAEAEAREKAQRELAEAKQKAEAEARAKAERELAEARRRAAEAEAKRRAEAVPPIYNAARTVPVYVREADLAKVKELLFVNGIWYDTAAQIPA
ncbi:MAG: DUF1351 domain-containing protein [Clostridiales bacterium]|nr:DUF1351 domain-containing protein [Clostridiales bacterium]